MTFIDASKLSSDNGEERILLVDDNPTNLQLLLQTLDGRGYKLLVAKGGEAAIDIARKTKPAVILLDVMMPGMDGFETCRRLKADPATRDSAVIFLSALNEVHQKVSGFSLGAVDYITKPIQSDDVIARVQTHLTIQRLTRELQMRYAQIERELSVVRGVQQSLLPQKLPEIPGLALAAYYETSRHAGGDYYDIVEIPGNRWGIMVADVSGHGAAAAVVMAMTRAVFHAKPELHESPTKLLQFLNEHFRYMWGAARFVTALYCVYDANTRTLDMACAGHCPPLLYRAATRRVEVLPCQRVIPLIIQEMPEVPVVQVQLHPSDRLLLYTDGITERFSPAREEFGVERLRQALVETVENTPQGAIEGIMSRVRLHASDRPPGDDQTLLLCVVK
jgi:serine phosphatase RsbU (regulator of sigma subunit)